MDSGPSQYDVAEFGAVPVTPLQPTGRKSIAGLAVACSLTAAASSLEPIPLLTPEDAGHYAEQAMARTIVVQGSFVAFCDDDLVPTLTETRLVALAFAVNVRFKGDDDRHVLPISVSSDLLACPPEELARYEQRQRLRQRLADQMAAIEQELHSPVRHAKPEPSKHFLELQRRHWEIGQRFNALNTSELTASDDARFVWDLGGTVTPGRDYLLALEPDDDGNYVIGVLFDGSMLWEPHAEQVATVIRTRGRVGL